MTSYDGKGRDREDLKVFKELKSRVVLARQPTPIKVKEIVSEDKSSVLSEHLSKSPGLRLKKHESFKISEETMRGSPLNHRSEKFTVDKLQELSVYRRQSTNI